MLQVINEMKTQFENHSVNEAFARMAAAAFLAPLDPLVEEISEIKTAVSEAVTNAAVHGYGDAPGKILLKVTILPDRLVRITVSDKGKGIADIQQARKALYTTCTTGERSGMGFTIMETFCDRVTVRSKVGKGTTITLYKKLAARE